MKAHWVCPNCQGTLRKKKEDGEHVKRCPECKASWFIILCHGPVENNHGQLELFTKDGKANARKQNI